MLKSLAIFIFILAAGFYLVLSWQNQLAEEIIENDEIHFLTQKITEEASETSVENIISEEKNNYSILNEIQEKLDDISEQIDILAKEIKELSFLKQVAGVETELSFASSTELAEDEEETDEEVIEEEETEQDETEENEEIPIVQPPAQNLCQIEPGISPERNKIIINELAWMGNTGSADSEWMEIKNLSGSEIDLSGWQIISADGKIKIFFNKEDFLPAFAFYLLERTDDETLPGLPADKIYKGSLKNGGDNLYLFDENCRLQDAILADLGWPAGNNDSKRTMERKSDFMWQTSADAGGTPKSENSGGYYQVFSGGGAVISPPKEKPVYPKILISEIQIESKNSKKDDFVELYNPNNEDVDLTGWYLQKKTESGGSFGTYAPAKFFELKIIKSKSYFIVVNSSSSFDGDITTSYSLAENNTLALKNPNGDIADQVGFGNAQDFEGATTTNPGAGNSIGRRWSTSTEDYIDTDNNYHDFEIQIPTPNSKNQSPPLSNQLPLAIFSFLPDSKPLINQEVLFDASFSTDPDGAIAMYNWDFGDNNYATETQATTIHSFATSGEFLIALFVIDNLGATSSLATATINIIPPPQPILEVLTSTLSFRGEEDETILSQTVIFANSGQSELNWQIGSSSTSWLLINGLSNATGTILASSSANIEFSANILGQKAGNYTATATITADGAQNSPKDISINLTIFPETTKTVVINEIAWMGTSATNSADEWIELYNNTDEDIDLLNWELFFGSTTINFSTSSVASNTFIATGGFYLLERTDDNTLPDISANFIYKGALRNNGEKLELRNASSTLIDLVDCSTGWFAGHASPDYISMERIDPDLPGSYSDNWETSLEVGGTPKSQNSVSL